MRVDRMGQRVDLLSDKQQDWRLVAGQQNDTHTVIRAVRAILTHDNVADYPITVRKKEDKLLAK